MTWWAPFTFTAGNGLTAAELNKYLYDNMRETLTGKLQEGVVDDAEGQWFSTDNTLPNSVVGFNLKSYESSGAWQFGDRSSSTYGTPVASAGRSYTNPSVTVKTGTRALAILCTEGLSKDASGDAAGDQTSTYVSIAVSGATTVAASDTYSIRQSGNWPQSVNSGGLDRTSLSKVCNMYRWFTGLNPGNNTFYLQMRSTDGDRATITDPSLVVIPFG